MASVDGATSFSSVLIPFSFFLPLLTDVLVWCHAPVGEDLNSCLSNKGNTEEALQGHLVKYS